jgi:hypothetical protein
LCTPICRTTSQANELGVALCALNLLTLAHRFVPLKHVIEVFSSPNPPAVTDEVLTQSLSSSCVPCYILAITSNSPGMPHPHSSAVNHLTHSLKSSFLHRDASWLLAANLCRRRCLPLRVVYAAMQCNAQPRCCSVPHCPVLATLQIRALEGRLSSLVDDVVGAYHAGFTRSISNYSQTLALFQDAREQVSSDSLSGCVDGSGCCD